MRILIVDDSKAMRLLVRRALRQAGYGAHEVVEAASGPEALEVVRGGKVDLVLSDWNMPDMSGIELLQALRSEGFTTTFGFITTETTPPMRAAANAAGAAFLVAKPFTPEALQLTLDGVVGAR